MSEKLNIVVCVKQTPMVSELPWNPKTGTLMRESAEGMINPACRHALEAALRLKESRGAFITVISMGPPMAEEAVREALALGADKGILLCDRAMAGADTLSTSYTLGCAIRKTVPDFDLVICGCHTADSETAQVGPQLSVDLDIPGASYVDHMEMNDGVLRLERLSDGFLETMEVELPALVTISTRNYAPRYVPVNGLEKAFSSDAVFTLGASDIDADISKVGAAGSATKILKVYSPTEGKQNIVMKGAPKKIADDLLERYADLLGGAIGKDLKK